MRALQQTYGAERAARYLATVPQLLVLKDYQVRSTFEFLQWLLGKASTFQAVDDAPEVRAVFVVEGQD